MADASYAGSYGGQGLMDTEALLGSDARKVALTKFLRERTTVSLEWVARALSIRGGGELGALRANAAVAECGEESPEGEAALHQWEVMTSDEVYDYAH
jgi:hypothetical protein